MARKLAERLIRALDQLTGLAEGPAVKGRRQRPPPDEDLARAPDPASALAARQDPDGGFGADPARTAAALAAWAHLGQTRRGGANAGAVQRAAAWLLLHPDPLGARALELLERTEAGECPAHEERYAGLGAAGAEGALFSALRGRRVRAF